jgi:hypothetical protein
MKRSATLWFVVLIGIRSAGLCAADCRALIISGDPGQSAIFAERFHNWTARWKSVLTEKYGFKSENVRVLRSPAKPGESEFPEKAEGDEGNIGAAHTLAPEVANVAPKDTATLENVMSAFETLVRESRADDQAVIILIGHGYDSQGLSKLCLPGKDLTDAAAARALENLKAKLVCINTAPSSAPWSKSLARKGRIIVTAVATAEQRSQTCFCEFLLRALQPGNVNMLDAFNSATLATTRFYQNQYLEKKTTTVHGAEFQEVYKALYSNRLMVNGSKEPQAANNNMEDMQGWLGRRVLMEVAGLEDNGDGTPSTIYEDGKNPAPLPTKAGEGECARTVILGKP